jgi:hypothetical protein
MTLRSFLQIRCDTGCSVPGLAQELGVSERMRAELGVGRNWLVSAVPQPAIRGTARATKVAHEGQNEVIAD